MIDFSSKKLRRAAFALSLLFVFPTAFFALRSYGSFRLLRSAYEAGAPKTSSIRAWMTVGYIAGVYHIPAAELRDQLKIPSNSGEDTTLRSAAEQSGVSPYQYVARAQRIVAAQGSNGAAGGASESSGWLGALGDQALSALLVYGYPALGLSVLLGAIGLPLPQGLATIVAGSLASEGRFNWIVAGSITVVASVLGDAVDYGCGVLLGRELLQRYGRWLGFSNERQDRVRSLFDKWGLGMVLVTRTFVSYLSSSASLLAGVSHYRLSKFLGVTVVGRVVWTAAYLGLGYVIGTDLESATAFLTNLSGLIFFALALFLSGVLATGHVESIIQ